MTASIVAPSFRSGGPVSQRQEQVEAASSLAPAALLVYATLIPMEVRFDLAGATIYAPRFIAFLLLPWILRALSQGRLRRHPIDLMMFAGTAWMVISFCAFYDIATGLSRGIPLAFDVILPYLVARLSIRNLNDLRRILIYCAPGFFVAGASMAAESLLRVQFLRPTLANYFGRLLTYENGVAVGQANFFQFTRFGLMRANGPFSHPILGGIYMATLAPLYAMSGVRKWPLWMGLFAGGCAIFSLSSGAFLALLIGLAIISTERLRRYFSFLNWPKIVGAIGIVLILAHILSQNGIVSLIIRYTLDPATGYYRQLIWEFGTQSVARHPLIGIGYTDFERLAWMGTSVDNYWLLLAMRHGVISSFMIFGAVVLSIFSLGRRVSSVDTKSRNMIIAVSAIMVAFLIVGFTVTFFGNLQPWVYFMIGTAVSLCYVSVTPRAAHPF